jgi:hypothetical protein
MAGAPPVAAGQSTLLQIRKKLFSDLMLVKLRPFSKFGVNLLNPSTRGKNLHKSYFS